MDPRQQGQEYAGNNPSRSGGNYGFNGGQNDSFSSFVHTDNEPVFDTPWNAPPFNSHQQQVGGYNQGSNGWQESPYQSLQMSNYGVQPRDYDQAYSRSPASFNYSGYETTPSQTFSPSPYENSLGYPQLPMNSNPSYDYGGQQTLQQHHATVSPQALQNYGNSFTQTPVEESRQSNSVHYDSTLPVQRPVAAGVGPLSHQDWVNLSAVIPESIVAKGMHIKPTAGLSNATKSTRVDGFTFVGNSSVASNTSKILVPRFRRRKTLKDYRRLLEYEKGGDPWHRDREPLVKKLKTAETKLSGPRSAAPSTHGRAGSVAESASPSESSESESDDDSDYYSESGGEVQHEEPSPLPASRPTNPNEAVEYDIIKAVWAKKSVTLSGTVIRTALGEIWDIFKGIRDKWKLKVTSLTQAVEKKDLANIKAYERRITEQRRLLESGIRLTLKHGHPDIVERLGENPAFLLVFYQFLADRFKDSEYTGGLIAAILELLTKCITIDQSILEKTKMDKVLPRIVKRGDDQGRMFAQRILDNAADISKQKVSGIKLTKKQPSNDLAEKPQTDGSRSGDVNDTKPVRSLEAKKVSSSTSKGNGTLSATKSINSSDSRQTHVKMETKTGLKGAVADVPLNKVKANVIPAKPSGFFSSLKSASKKPGTSAKADDGKPSANPSVKNESKVEPQKPAFSFTAALAALNTKKEEQPIKIEETKKPETTEEKRRRLRKENRRKLRVSWKEDDDLVQIREFIHDPEEEMGHEDSQVRDVGDSRGEGQMLKMHKDREEVIDDDEDYEPPEEVLLPDWRTPTDVDFSDIGAADLEQNFFSRGGKVQVESQERTAQEQRELTTLMVIYSTPSDIPPSPREPADHQAGEEKTEVRFGEPGEMIKERENQYSARQNSGTPAVDISALLRIMNSQKPTQPPPPQQVAATPAAPVGIDALIAQLANNNKQQAALPMQMPQPPQPQPSFNLQAALANMSQPTQPPQLNYSAQPASVPNLQAILAQLPAQPAPPTQGYSYPNQYQAENERKRPYDQEDSDFAFKRSRGSGPENKKFVFKGVPTVQCRFWQEGKCRKGDECTFLHQS